MGEDGRPSPLLTTVLGGYPGGLRTLPPEPPREGALLIFDWSYTPINTHPSPPLSERPPLTACVLLRSAAIGRARSRSAWTTTRTIGSSAPRSSRSGAPSMELLPQVQAQSGAHTYSTATTPPDSTPHSTSALPSMLATKPVRTLLPNARRNRPPTSSKPRGIHSPRSTNRRQPTDPRLEDQDRRWSAISSPPHAPPPQVARSLQPRQEPPPPRLHPSSSVPKRTTDRHRPRLGRRPSTTAPSSSLTLDWVAHDPRGRRA